MLLQPKTWTCHLHKKTMACWTTEPCQQHVFWQIHCRQMHFKSSNNTEVQCCSIALSDPKWIKELLTNSTCKTTIRFWMLWCVNVRCGHLFVLKNGSQHSDSSHHLKKHVWTLFSHKHSFAQLLSTNVKASHNHRQQWIADMCQFVIHQRLDVEQLHRWLMNNDDTSFRHQLLVGHLTLISYAN